MREMGERSERARGAGKRGARVWGAHRQATPGDDCGRARLRGAGLTLGEGHAVPAAECGLRCDVGQTGACVARGEGYGGLCAAALAEGGGRPFVVPPVAMGAAVRLLVLATLVAACLLVAMVGIDGACGIALADEETAADAPAAWTCWQSRELAADLDGDGVRESRVLVGEAAGDANLHGACVQTQGTSVFESPQGWEVFDALVSDVDGDGADELVFMVWKRGSYGPYRPFWVEDDPQTWSQHVYVYEMRQGRIAPIWMSSQLDFEVASASFDEAGRLVLATPEGGWSAWQWESWGFVLDEAYDADGSAVAEGGESGDGEEASSSEYTYMHISADTQSNDVVREAVDNQLEAAGGEDATDVVLDKSVSGLTAADIQDESPRAAAACTRIESTSQPTETDARTESSQPGQDATVSTATLCVAGDNIIYQGIYAKSYDPASRAFDFSDVYAHVADYIASFDLAALTQETVLVQDASRASSYPQFATPADLAQALAQAGFDLIAGATNHVCDQGAQAVLDELAYLDKAAPGLAVAGLHDEADAVCEPALVQAGDVSLAWFDVTYGLNGYDPDASQAYVVDTLDDIDELEAQIRAAKADPEVDCVALTLHIGEEYDATPSAQQRQVVERLVDAGADLVFCSHSHVVGPYGAYTTQEGNTALVYWGLGNFVAAQGELACQVGGLATIELEKTTDAQGDSTVRVSTFDLVPTVCHVDTSGAAAVYLLSDYTDDLAARYSLSDPDAPLTVFDFRAAFEAGISENCDENSR